MEELGYTRCHRDHVAFRIGTRRKGVWAVCAFWVDDETRIWHRTAWPRSRYASQEMRDIGREGAPLASGHAGEARFQQAHGINLTAVLYLEREYVRIEQIALHPARL